MQFQARLQHLVEFLRQVMRGFENLAEEIDHPSLRTAMRAISVESKQYAKEINSSRIDNLIQIGTTYRQAVQNANSIQNASTISANQPLFTAVANKYRAAAGTLQGAILADIPVVCEPDVDVLVVIGNGDVVHVDGTLGRLQLATTS